MSCEDQGYGLISDGCIQCARWENGKLVRPALVKVLEYGVEWWRCPKCNGSYGAAEPITVNGDGG